MNDEIHQTIRSLFESLDPENTVGHRQWGARELVVIDKVLMVIRESGDRSAYIDEVKYGGALVLLDDGSRWEVDELDRDTADGWLEGSLVLVKGGEMFPVDDLSRAAVEEEI